jgi:hypothetical protein
MIVAPLYHWDRIIEMTSRALRGDKLAIKRIRRRARLYYQQLKGMPIDDSEFAE